MFEPIQSGIVCVHVASAYAYFDAPNVATKIGGEDLATVWVDHRHGVAAVVDEHFLAARCTWRIERASVLRYSW